MDVRNSICRGALLLALLPSAAPPALAQATSADYGGAPAATTAQRKLMTGYPGVTAHFPSALLPGQQPAVTLPGDTTPLPASSSAPLDLAVDREVPAVTATWVQVPHGKGTVSLAANTVQLALRNSAAEAMEVTVELTFVANGTKRRQQLKPVQVPAGGQTVIDDALGWAMADAKGWRAPVAFLGELAFRPVGRAVAVAATEGIALQYAHPDQLKPDNIVLYGEEAYAAQLQTRTFVGNASLSHQLRAALPAGPVLEGLSEVGAYVHGDPVLHEPAPDALDESSLATAAAPAAAGQSPVTVCMEWYTAPVDNNFGEDYGLNDDGWRARGAEVRIYYTGTLLYDSYLDSLGCAVVYITQGGGTIRIQFDGRARLSSNGGYNYLHLIGGFNGMTPIHVSAYYDISNVQPNQIYRPELMGRDGFSILSYAAQERFNGDLTGRNIYVWNARCRLAVDDSCATTYNGLPLIFIQPSQWRRKFLIGHEWGHSILAQAANYANDCRYGDMDEDGDGNIDSHHGMNSLEYSSCAAMEGWAHFVGADIWNEHDTDPNPTGTFVYWNGAVLDVEEPSTACYAQVSDSLCDDLGVEQDWMRQWWDYHTNNRAVDYGSPPSHAALFGLIDDTIWQSGSTFEASNAIQDALAGAQESRWRTFACVNGIAWDACPYP